MKKSVVYLIMTILSVINFCAFAEWVEVKKWDMQTYSDVTWAKLTADTANWKLTGRNRFDSKVDMSDVLKINGINLTETEGILFPELVAGDFSIRKGLGIQLGSNNKMVTVQNRHKGEKIEIVFSSTNSTGERGISGAVNMIGELGNTIKPKTFTFTVLSDGDIAFNYSAAGGIVLISITVYSDDAKPDAPALYKFSDNMEQTIYVEQSITDIVYNWGNTANSAVVTWAGEIPEGITVNTKIETKTLTISGKPVSAGIYEYSIVATDGTQNSTPQTGTITVNALSADKKLIAYITDSAIPTDAADIAIIAKLRETYEVITFAADTLQPASAFDKYDAIVLAALPVSATIQTCLKGINKPLVTVKPYMFKNWGWGTPINIEAPAIGATLKNVPVGVTVLNTGHPIFAGLRILPGIVLPLATDSKHDRLRILTPMLSWTGNNEANIITLATVPTGTYNYTVTSPEPNTVADVSGKPVIFEIKPNSVMSDENGNVVTITKRTIHIGLSERVSEYITPEFLSIVKNSVDYVLGGGK